MRGIKSYGKKPITQPNNVEKLCRRGFETRRAKGVEQPCKTCPLWKNTNEKGIKYCYLVNRDIDLEKMEMWQYKQEFIRWANK